MTTTDALTKCNAALGATGYVCSASEDALSYTVTMTYDTARVGLSLLPKPASLSYSAYQVKYAVQ